MEKHLFIMGSLTGKFSEGILGGFIFKAAVWSTGCFKNSVPGSLEKPGSNQLIKES
ncbi:hypothetical protein HDE69_003816 [Pedobacter cryoconitis]|uniref:Uncharacterized protein n=1 Tax=Pedobacter cryoconitis TaxID=188932 RepID=A0A7W8YW58_9SPHI|nr:hypothetical protein [Pedobacter cryoconitis]MBB5622738.1 hypothetical protein [Pedobacter cryoconitis]